MGAYFPVELGGPGKYDAISLRCWTYAMMGCVNTRKPTTSFTVPFRIPIQSSLILKSPS